MIARVEAIFLQTTRLAELSEFYRAGLELGQPQAGDEGQLGFQLGEVYFAIEQVPAHAPPPGATTVWFWVEDVRVAYTRLLELGGQIKSPPSEIGKEIVATVFDPDGNAIGLIGSG